VADISARGRVRPLRAAYAASLARSRAHDVACGGIPPWQARAELSKRHDLVLLLKQLNVVLMFKQLNSELAPHGTQVSEMNEFGYKYKGKSRLARRGGCMATSLDEVLNDLPARNDELFSRPSLACGGVVPWIRNK